MRSWSLIALALPAVCTGQTVHWPGFSAAVRKVVQQDGKLPDPKKSGDKSFKLIHADSASVNGDEVVAKGHVHATYNGYDIYADSLRGSRKTQVFQLQGPSKLIGETETLEGGSVTIDFQSDRFSFTDTRATLKPERLDKRTTGDVYVRAGSGAGTKTDFSTQDGELTTCDLDPAHYELRYDSMRVLPGKRAELRRTSLVILGKTYLRLPMIVIPLDRTAPRYLPEVGQSVDEGFFVKTKISTPLHGQDNYLDTHVDLMTKKGAGLGWDYNYANARVAGKLTSYFLTGAERSRVFSADHRQRFGSATFNLNSIYQMSDYLTAPGSTLWNSTASLLLPRRGGSSRLSYNRSSSDSLGFSTSNEAFGLSDDGDFIGLASRFNASYTKSESSGFGTPTKYESVDLMYGATANFRSFTADLLYRRNIPVGQTANFYASSDVTPMVTLKTTSQQLFNKKTAEALPFNLEASVGEMINPSAVSNPRITRINFDLGFRRNERAGRNLTLDWGSKFKQGLYSDDTAQYVLGNDANLRYGFAKDSTFGVTYNYLRAFGFTPLTIDSSGRYDSFSFDLDYRPLKAVTLTAQSGYDIFQSSVGEVPWQFVWLRSRWNPGPAMDVGVSASYDTFSQAWSNLRLDSLLKLGSTHLTASARYDGIRSQWAGANVLIEGFKWGRVTTNALLDYNGYSKQFDSQHFQFIYDLHCAEAVFEVIENKTGFRDGRTFSLSIRLKAFPTGSNFGLTPRGNSIGGSFGSGN